MANPSDTKDVVVGREWVQLTTDSTKTSIECLYGFGFLRASSSLPASNLEGHRLNTTTDNFIVVDQPVYVRADSGSGNMVLVVT